MTEDDIEQIGPSAARTTLGMEPQPDEALLTGRQDQARGTGVADDLETVAERRHATHGEWHIAAVANNEIMRRRIFVWRGAAEPDRASFD